MKTKKELEQLKAEVRTLLFGTVEEQRDLHERMEAKRRLGKALLEAWRPVLNLTGEDGVDVERRLGFPPVHVMRGAAYHFDLYTYARRVGHGHLYWFVAGNCGPIRILDWRVFIRREKETPCLSDELWKELNMDELLPPEFRIDRIWSPEELLLLEKDCDADICTGELPPLRRDTKEG